MRRATLNGDETGKTQRLGIEAGLNGKYGKFDWYANYAYVCATFESALTIRSAHNPSANADGEIQVLPGDLLPGIPLHLGKWGASYTIGKNWSIGLESIISSTWFFRGDEGNVEPPVPGFIIFNLNSYYRLNDSVQAFVLITNLFNSDYETFGAFGATEEVAFRELPGGATDPRCLGPGAPFGLWVGARFTLPILQRYTGAQC